MLGVVLAKWDNKYGAKVYSKYPKDLQIDDEQAMSIYTFHSMGGLKSGFMAIKREDLNVASYFLNITETNEKYFLAILFEEDEDPYRFENKLTDISRELWQILLKPDIDENKIEEVLPKYFTLILKEQIAQLKKTTIEQQRELQLHKEQLDAIQKEVEAFRNNSEIVREFKNGSIEEKYSKLRKENLELKNLLRQNELKIRELKKYNETLKRDLKVLKEESIELRTKLSEYKAYFE
ncbi:MAG: hypothetical protein ACXQS8_07245 [Candidatus Helarchaeales archaeon]